MRTLSTNLVNAFPFLYLGVEFRKPENKNFILQTLQPLASTSHALPVISGEALLSAEPLIEAASVNIKGQLDDAIRLYNTGDFDSSQTKVQCAVQNCFACLTARSVGLCTEAAWCFVRKRLGWS